MFCFDAPNAHAWLDILKNVGKLSLAGLFMAGTLAVNPPEPPKQAPPPAPHTVFL